MQFKFNQDPDGQTPTSWPVSDASIVTIKGIKWSITHLLQGSQYADKFGGGIFNHAFLNTYSYHRQHAPVDCKAVEARIIQGQVYLETTVIFTREEIPPGRPSCNRAEQPQLQPRDARRA